jgi:hypothetical protein
MRIGTLVFSGKSGAKYRFEVWPMETRFKPLAAVYIVTKREVTTGTFSRAGHEQIYLGQTPDISGPLGTQAQLDSFSASGANCVCVYAVESEERGAAIKKDLEEAAVHLKAVVL